MDRLLTSLESVLVSAEGEWSEENVKIVPVVHSELLARLDVRNVVLVHLAPQPNLSTASCAEKEHLAGGVLEDVKGVQKELRHLG